MGLPQEIAHRRRAGHAEHLLGGDRVAHGLGHLLPAVGDEPVVQPEAGEAVPGGRRLGQLVLVVREPQVQAAAVDVELGAEVLRGHGRALQVPSGAAGPPGRLPHGGGGLAGLGALPQGEVAGVALAARVGVGRVLHVLHALAGELAVALPRPDVEVDVARAVLRGVGVAALHQALDEREHLGHVAGGARLVGGTADAEGEVGGVERLLEPVGQGPPRLAGRVEVRGLEAGLVGGGRAVEDLVVDVRHVPHRGDAQPGGLEPADEDVEHDRAAHVAHVRHALHRGPAVVHRRLAGHEGLEVPDLRGAGVVEALGHGGAVLPEGRGPDGALPA